MDRFLRAVSLLAVVAPIVAGCSGASEHTIIGQFFNASRLRDNTSLDNLATVIFDPRTQGTVTTFTIESIGPEQRRPLPLKSLAKSQEDAKAEDAAFTKRKEDYQNANLEAIQRVLKAERENAKLASTDADVQTAWSKFREETAQSSKKMADIRRSLRSETQLVDLSVNAGRTAIDVTKYEGELASKEVTVSAPVRLPDGTTAQKKYLITLQRATLRGDKDITGRWIVTSYKDAASSGATKTSN